MSGQAVTGLVDGAKALRLFDEGATVVFQGLHRYWPPLTELVTRLERELGHPCQANAYLTPPGSQGFAVHADSHDVFVFQTAGTKRWEIHDADGAQDVLFEPGLVAYLPTGTRHAARAQEHTSLHVTIGINQLTMRGLLQRTLADALIDAPGTHLPAGWIDDPAPLSAALADELAALADRLRATDANAAVQRESRRHLTQRPPRVGGGLLDRLALEQLDDDTTLVRRPGHPCEVVPGRDGTTLDVLLGDRVLTVPARLRDALTVVEARERLTPGDLADTLDEQSRIVLCRRLVREGLLRIAR
jgi:mannose-6-phosphate isomerase-like protein (cupin superfamily)